MKSIRNINKYITIQDMTNGDIIDVFEYDLVNDTNFGNSLLLYRVMSVLDNEHDCLVKCGYKSE